jgi:predicted GIY-YIG superfamily endonuclease
MYYVYLLESLHTPDQRYVGHTDDLKRRISEHNKGGSPHTAKYRPWNLVSYHAFPAEKRAVEFEHYLKSGSGRAFAKRHFGF